MCNFWPFFKSTSLAIFKLVIKLMVETVLTEFIRRCIFCTLGIGDTDDETECFACGDAVHDTCKTNLEFYQTEFERQTHYVRGI